MPYERPDSAACPHDGWYNGNPQLMIENGTFDDFYDKLRELVEAGKIKEAAFAQFQAQWDAIPLAEKKKRRDQVVADSTPVPVRDRDGKVDMLAKPSDNGAVTRRTHAEKQHLSIRRAKGALTMKNDPLARKMKELSVSSPAGSVTTDDALALGAKPVPTMVK